jgi:hypothetical protein
MPTLKPSWAWPVFSTRALMEQGKGKGRLQQETVSNSLDDTNPSTHVVTLVIPFKAYRTSIGFPLSSNDGETSKAERTDATKSQVDISARYCPGHTLKFW